MSSAARIAPTTRVAYNSCRNRHCPKCQGAAARQWLAEREAELLPVAYYHVVFTLPAAIGAIGFQNKAAVYDLLFRTAAETLITIAADPKHLGARIGLTAVLHTWGSALTHHPHVHVIVPGGGLSPDGSRWIACKPGFFLPVRVLSRLFRRLFLDGLAALNQAGRLAFRGDLAPLADKSAFDAALAPLRRSAWVVYAKRPFAGPQAVLAYLARYTHRVAISNSRLITLDEAGVTFKWKDYRIKGRDRLNTITLDARRVHPPLSPARAAERLPPHPPLRPLRQRRSSAQHRARPPIAGRARGLAAKRARRGRQRDRNTFACAPLPVLRRPDDHCRNLRRRAPRALAITDPDQDRHLMTVAALPAAQRRFSSPPTARRSRKAMSSQGRRSSSKRRAHTRPSHPRPRKTPSSSLPPRTMRATGPRSPTSAPSATPKSP